MSLISEILDISNSKKINMVLQKSGWMSVPQFGGWDQKMNKTDYSMVFQRARANRKENKTYFKAASLGNEQELISHSDEESPSVSKPSLSRIPFWAVILT